jgi:hypothetical protein
MCGERGRAGECREVNVKLRQLHSLRRLQSFSQRNDLLPAEVLVHVAFVLLHTWLPVGIHS